MAYSTMLDRRPPKPVEWMGSSREDLQSFPEPVQDEVGYALYAAQCGEHPQKSTRGIATPLHEIARIKARYARARMHHAEHYGTGEEP